MKFITNGLIIREQSIREKDKLVTALTESHGVVKGFAHGAKDIKSPKCAATGLLCYSRLTLHKSKDSYIIGDAKALKIFSGLRADIERMYLGQYFCELAEALCPKEQDTREHLRLILNGLHLLSEGKRPLLLIKACVELRLLCLSGYMPDLVMCRRCGAYEKESMCFFPREGAIVCADCLSEADLSLRHINLNRTILTALRHCCYAEDGKLFSFTIPEDDLKTLNLCSEEYLKAVTDRDYKTLQFLKALG